MRFNTSVFLGCFLILLFLAGSIFLIDRYTSVDTSRTATVDSASEQVSTVAASRENNKDVEAPKSPQANHLVSTNVSEIPQQLENDSVLEPDSQAQLAESEFISAEIPEGAIVYSTKATPEQMAEAEALIYGDASVYSEKLPADSPLLLEQPLDSQQSN